MYRVFHEFRSLSCKITLFVFRLPSIILAVRDKREYLCVYSCCFITWLSCGLVHRWVIRHCIRPPSKVMSWPSISCSSTTRHQTPSPPSVTLCIADFAADSSNTSYEFIKLQPVFTNNIWLTFRQQLLLSSEQFLP